ncbi:hypothetical protein BS78_03G397700 [Paspalum vaginatum]|nr:hypothetical protein BS78_03G397700 [Paspalum vaginatum]
MSLHGSSLLLLLLLASTLAAGDDGRSSPSKPIVVRLTKDPSTSLYTISIKDGGAPLLVDLAGPLVWSTCAPGHPTVPSNSSECRIANRNNRPPANCVVIYENGGQPQPQPGCDTADRHCSAYPYNPLLASLPPGAAGVAGLSRLPLAPPSQAASALNLPRQFALCLPTGGGRSGAAIFGGGPFQLLAAPPVDVADGLLEHPLPLLRNPRNGAYYIRVTGIVVNNERVPLDLHARSGTGGVMLSTATPYTTLRPDIYRPLLAAFDAATSGIPRAEPVRLFEMCYQASALSSTRIAASAGGSSWLLAGNASLVQVNDHTVCFAFLEMGPSSTDDGGGSLFAGGHLWWEAFGFRGPLPFIRTNCGNFDFNNGYLH